MERPQDKLINRRQCPEKETIKKKKNLESPIQWNGHKKILEIAGSAPKRTQLKKKKTLSQLDNGTATRQARNSRQFPEKETIKRKP